MSLEALSVIFGVVPFLWVVGGTVLLSLLVGLPDPRCVLRAGLAISPALGIAGFMAGIIAMLHNLDDPTTIGPAIGLALSPVFVGSLVAVVCHALLGPTGAMETPPHDASSAPLVIGFVRGGVASVLLMGLIGVIVVLNGTHGSALVNVPAFVWVCLLTPPAALVAARGQWSEIGAFLARYALVFGFLGFLASLTPFLVHFHDPSQMGPYIAIGFLSLLYATYLYGASSLLHVAIGGKEVEGRGQTTIWLVAGTVLCVGFVLALTCAGIFGASS